MVRALVLCAESRGFEPRMGQMFFYGEVLDAAAKLHWLHVRGAHAQLCVEALTDSLLLFALANLLE